MNAATAQQSSRLRRFFAEGFRPWATSAWEWTGLRLFFAAVVADDLADPANFRATSLEKPHGLAAWVHGTPLDLTFLARDGVEQTYLAVAVCALAVYVLLPLLGGVKSDLPRQNAATGTRVSGELRLRERGGRAGWRELAFAAVTTLLLVLHVLPRTVQNSQGSIHHSHQVIGLVLLAQVVVAWVLVVRRARGRNLPAAPAAGSDASLFAFYSLGILMASYLSAGLSKLFNSKGLWVWNAPWISFDLIKSERQAYYKKLEPELAGGTQIAEWVLQHPWLARAAFGGAFFLEILALLALKNRRWAVAVGCGLIALHAGIWALMHLEFQAHLLCLLIFAINPLGWVISGRRAPKRLG